MTVLPHQSSLSREERERIRREAGLAGAEVELRQRVREGRGNPADAFAVLVILEQAELERDEAYNAGRDEANERLSNQIEARLAKVPALVEALRGIVATTAWLGPDGTHDSWKHWATQAEEALAGWETE